MSFTLTPELSFLLGLAVFWVVLYALAYVFHLDKHGLEVKPGFFMYKSKALTSFLDRVANKWRLLWKALSNIGLAFSIGLMVFAIYILVNNLFQFFFVSVSGAVPLTLLIPGLTIRLYWLPFFFLAVGINFLPHELAHGIVARLKGIPILSSGILALLVFPGAFVEHDEKEFEKASILDRLRMVGVGSSTNLVVALLVTLLMAGLFIPTPAGVLIQEVTPNGPLDKAGLRQWDVIKAINGTSIYVPENFTSYMSKVTPNTTVVLTVLHDNREMSIPIKTEPSPTNSSRAIVGIDRATNYLPNRLGLEQYAGVNLYWSLFWIYLLGISVAVFNMLPAAPFDGERVLYYPLASLVKKRKRELRWTLNVIAWGLFVSNIALSFWRYGLFKL